MAKHRKHYHRRRHNPFGVSGGIVKDASLVAGGAIASMWLPTFLPSQNSGFMGVGLTVIAALASSFAAKALSGPAAASEVLKGGLAAAAIRTVHTAGVFKSLTMGLYAPSYFSVPTASSQYLQSAAPGMTFNRGYGSIYGPGPGTPMLAAKAGNLGYHRFRSRYAGNYGG